jgi:hypothetical protein
MQQKNSAKKSQVTRKKARLSCKKIIDWQQKNYGCLSSSSYAMYNLATPHIINVTNNVLIQNVGPNAINTAPTNVITNNVNNVFNTAFQLIHFILFIYFVLVIYLISFTAIAVYPGF